MRLAFLVVAIAVLQLAGMRAQDTSAGPDVDWSSIADMAVCDDILKKGVIGSTIAQMKEMTRECRQRACNAIVDRGLMGYTVAQMEVQRKRCLERMGGLGGEDVDHGNEF